MGHPYTSGVTVAIWFEVVGFGVGLLFGSILNVCISRLPGHESIVTPGSHCMACLHAVRWFDNVPVLSWVVLRGRCRDCGAGISWRYPVVELAVGIWFAAVVAHTPIDLKGFFGSAPSFILFPSL